MGRKVLIPVLESPVFTCKNCGLLKAKAHFSKQHMDAKGNYKQCNMCAHEQLLEKRHRAKLKKNTAKSIAKICAVQQSWLSPLSYNIKEL